jgi:4-hydroxy-tetrahydrodipicolinate synthase
MFDFKGTGVAIITPFDKNKSIDYPALKKIINYIIEGGIDYLVTLGTTGETPVLSKDEKLEIINFTKNEVNARVPLVVGIGGNNTSEVVNDLMNFPLEGVSAILSASPNYNKPSQEGIYQHYKEIALRSPKPIILYNVPGRTSRNIAAATTIRLANDFENIIGIKEASGDMLQCMEIIKNKPDRFFVVSGDDALALPQIACGMQGVISVAANAFPSEYNDMVKLCLNNDYNAARKINDKLIPAYQYLFEENNPAGVKAFLYEMGFIENELRLPLVSLSEDLHQSIKNYLGK